MTETLKAFNFSIHLECLDSHVAEMGLLNVFGSMVFCITSLTFSDTNKYVQIIYHDYKSNTKKRIDSFSSWA